MEKKKRIWIRKEHFKVLIKIYLNGSRRTVNSLLEPDEMLTLKNLVEAGYVEYLDHKERYVIITMQCRFEKIMDNFLDNLVNMVDAQRFISEK